MIKSFAVLNADGVVQMGFQCEVPEVGPAPRFPKPVAGCEYVEIESPFIRDHSSQTAIAKWDGGKIVWIESASLVELRALKIVEINAAHELANKTSFTFQGKEIQADPHAMTAIQITDAGILRRNALRADWLGWWKTRDNDHVAIPDVATWNAFFDAIEETGARNFDKAQALKVAIAEAETPEALAAITW